MKSLIARAVLALGMIGLPLAPALAAFGATTTQTNQCTTECFGQRYSARCMATDACSCSCDKRPVCQCTAKERKVEWNPFGDFFGAKPDDKPAPISKPTGSKTAPKR